jgi:hypothetical protein
MEQIMEKLVDAISRNFGTIGLLGFLALLAILSTVRELARIWLDVARQRSSDLLSRRFTAYGLLWSQMNELAIYSSIPFDEKVAQSVRDRLSAWYFSADGGMLLSATARDFYFGLQRVLRKFSDAAIRALPRDNEPQVEFRKLLNSHSSMSPRCVAAHNDDRPERMPGASWLRLCEVLADDVLSELTKNPLRGSELAFCVAQQVSSALRSRLAFEVQSRLDPAPKWWRFWSRGTPVGGG